MGYYVNRLNVDWTQTQRQAAGAAAPFGMTSWGGQKHPTFNYIEGTHFLADKWPGSYTQAMGIRFMRELHEELVSLGADPAANTTHYNTFKRVEPRAVAIRIDLLERDIRRRNGPPGTPFEGALIPAHYETALIPSRDQSRVAALVLTYNELSDAQKSYTFRSAGTNELTNAALEYDAQRDLNPARIALLQAAADRFDLVLQTP